KKIADHPGTRKLYADRLVAQGVLSENEPEEMVKAYRRLMEDGRRTVEPVLTDYKNKYATDWTPFQTPSGPTMRIPQSQWPSYNASASVSLPFHRISRSITYLTDCLKTVVRWPVARLMSIGVWPSI